MIKRLLAFLMTLVLLTVSLYATAEEGAEADAEAVKGPVAKTMDDLNAMLDGSEPVTRVWFMTPYPRVGIGIETFYILKTAFPDLKKSQSGFRFLVTRINA